MALFDLFGVKKDLKDDADVPKPPEGGDKGGPSKRTLGLFVIADIAVVVLCAVFLAARVAKHLSASDGPAPAPKAAKQTVRKKTAAPKKAPKKKPEAKKAPEKKAPKKKTPAKAAPARKKTAAAARKKRSTRPVPFTYVDPSAREVALLGAFLVRQNGRKSMFKDSKGTWSTTVYLNTGVTYRYKFEVVDKNGRKSITPTESVDVVAR